MTGGDREAIEALMRRIDHVAAIAHLIGQAEDGQLGHAIGGLGEMLLETAEKIDRILSNTKAA